ncbi:Protein CbbQ [Geodia barretti]|uniref:Protein CbbQ n=1 Tax=Geodia barretti TaxID=519541 RepID=A0AA35SWP1_GEOBA|nr:Protein CbbQ [Geodia barretti]
MAEHENYTSYLAEEYVIQEEPFYLPVGDEIELFEVAYSQNLPVLLKGPTGTGKTRFVEYMSYRKSIPLMTIACHEDLTASDLVGRYLLEGDETRWVDGPLARAVKAGAICYLDEIVEARKDTTVLIHPLTDHRRILPIDKRGEVLEAHDGFQLVVSYNPGYQSALKDLKHSTRQRFMALELTHPPADLEARIVQHESGVSEEMSVALAKLGEKARNLKDHGLQEGVGTRLLIYAGKLIARGIAPRRACQVAVTWALTDDQQVQRSVDEVVNSIFE